MQSFTAAGTPPGLGRNCYAGSVNPDLHSIARALDKLVAIHERTAWDRASTIAVLLTLIVLIWYTIETFRLRKAAQAQTEETGKLLKEAQRQGDTSASLLKEAQNQSESTATLARATQWQNEVPVMPVLAIVLVSPEKISTSALAYGGVTNRLVLKNVGRGPAFNTSVGRPLWDGKELQLIHRDNALGPDEERELRLNLQEGNTGYGGDPNTLYEWINTGKLPCPVKVAVICRSVTSAEYTFNFSFAPIAGHLNVSFEGMTCVNQQQVTDAVMRMAPSGLTE